jgi:hypothetical protein
MKHFGDLNACISLLRELQCGDDVEPKRKTAVEKAIREINRIRRKPHPKQHELHKSVRLIAESLVEAFVNRE